MHVSRFDRIAWSLIVAVVGLWILVGLAFGLGERLGWGSLAMHLVVPGIIFAIVAGIACRWHVVGATLLIGAGAVVAVGYPIVISDFFPTSTIVFVLFPMVAPLIAAGMLLLKRRRPVPR
jgi:hypothetical protein